MGEEAELTFDSVDLSRAVFLFTDLRRVRFLGARWNRSTRWREGRWRWRVYEEELWRKERRENASEADKKYLELLARLYRALKASYRLAGDHQLVGHFHYGLMEIQLYQRGIEQYPAPAATGLQRMRLFLKRWSKRLLSWDVLYRLSSGYGEDYTWTALVTVVLVVLSALAYWWLGIPPIIEPERTVYLASGASIPVQDPVSLSRQAMGALLYSLQVGSLGRVHYFSDPAQWPLMGELVYTLESFVVPIQVVFFAVALRNRFRR